MAEVKTESITGIVERLFFSSATFSTGKIKKSDSRESVSFAGKVYLRVGDSVTLHGKWTVHEKFGRQFSVTNAEHPEIVDTAGLAAWLAANAGGIGPVRASRIVSALGDKFSETLKSDLPAFCRVADICEEDGRALQTLWISRENVFAVATQLAAFGLTNHQVQTLTAKWGTSAARVVLDDPYVLMFTLDGFGWRKTDDIALKVGIPKGHPSRLAAGIGAAISDRIGDGSTCIVRNELLDAAGELLTLDSASGGIAIAARLDEISEAEKPQVVSVMRNRDAVKVYSSHGIFRAEKTVYQFLRSGALPHPSIHANKIGPLVDSFATMDGGKIVLDESQRMALRLAVSSRVCVVSGGAGAGKTVLVRAIYEMLKIGEGLSVSLCAFTGKAARRLEEVCHAPASTIHRLLEYMPPAGFARNEENPLDADVVIVDEISMNDVNLMSSLFRACSDKTAVVLVGDHNQLPAVGPGAILRDSLDKKIVPSFVLNHCHRQAGPLKENCLKILTGEVAPSIPGDGPHGTASPWMVHRKLTSHAEVMGCIEKLFTVHIPKWCFDPLIHVQFMSPIHRGPIGTQAVNCLLQRLHQKNLGVDIPVRQHDQRPTLFEGDKVIATKNNYSLAVMNGTTGIIKAVEGKDLVIDFGEKIVTYGSENKGEIELAYCTSVHKMQGSEMPCAITVCHSSHSFMLHRNILYTAATRARKTAILIGDEAGIRGAARRIEISQRRTLCEIFADNDSLENPS